MAQYRFLTYDLRTGGLLGELPLSNVRYSRVLNGVGTLSASLSLAHRTSLGGTLSTSKNVPLSSTYLSATQPQRTAIFAEREGVLVWGGIIWDRPYAKTQIGIEAGTFESYFYRRRLRTTKTYTGVDQLAIARDLITYAQSILGGNIGVTLDATVSGITRTRTYFGYERQVIGTLFEQLSEVDDGFDFGIDVSYNVSGAPQKILNLGYPRRGRIAGVTGLVFEPGKNLSDYEWNEIGSRGANFVDALGYGEGDAMLISPAARPDLITAGYPLLEDTVSHKEVRLTTTLAGHARAAVSARATPVVAVKLIDVFPDGDPPFGSWIMGDDILFRVNGDERFPAGADGSPGLARYVRIIGDEVALSDEGQETITITCGEILSA